METSWIQRCGLGRLDYMALVDACLENEMWALDVAERKGVNYGGIHLVIPTPVPCFRASAVQVIAKDNFRGKEGSPASVSAVNRDGM